MSHWRHGQHVCSLISSSSKCARCVWRRDLCWGHRLARGTARICQKRCARSRRLNSALCYRERCSCCIGCMR
eukprot:scaffold79061_cov30-Tisochrysis_lutea.AAC.2